MIDNNTFRNTLYWGLFADTVTFLREHLPAQDTDDYWQKTCRDASNLAEKYADTKQKKLCNTILEAMLNDLAGEQGG